MQIAHNHSATLDPTYRIGMPEEGKLSGKVFGPDIDVFPYGLATSPLLVFSPDEAETFAHMLLDAAKEARKLFPGD